MSDWDNLWEVLRATADILNQSESVSADTLEARTRQLARLPADSAGGRDIARALTFALGEEHYAWPVRRVRAIARIGRITPVPSAPPYYRGVLSLRGQVLSVMDVRVYLGMSPIETSAEYMIVIDGAGLEIGVLATEVFDVVSVPLNELTPASSAGLDSELVIGMTRDGLTLLDAEALLRRERYRVESEEEKKVI